jgi:hypothetical protein
MSDETIVDSTAEVVTNDAPTELLDQDQVEVENDESTEGEEVSEQPKPEKDPWYKRRIDELTRDKHEARRQAERLEKVLEQQEAMLRQMQPQRAAQEDMGPISPNPDDYVGGQFDPRYMQDMMAYTRESAKIEAIEAVKREQQAMMQHQAMAEQQRKLETAEAAARAKYSDYDGVNVILKEGLIKYGKTDIFLYFKKVDHENIYNLNVLYLLKDSDNLIFLLKGLNKYFTID